MNPICAIHGHDWFWRFAIRTRMCARCLYLDCTPLAQTSTASVRIPVRVPPALRWRPQVARSASA